MINDPETLGSKAEISPADTNNGQNSTSSYHQLRGTVLALIATALVLAGISYGLYWQDSERKFDIARPGRVTTSDDKQVTDIIEDVGSPVDEASVKGKLDFINQELRVLDNLPGFKSSNLSNQSLGLEASQPSF